MSTETTTTEPIPGDTPETRDLVKKGMLQVSTGKISLSDLLNTVLDPAPPSTPDRVPPQTKDLTEAQISALRLLPEIFGKVVVKSDRKLTEAERRSLVEERVVIDTVLGALEPRKSKVIRETLANDLDHLLPEEQAATAPKDRLGHYAVKQEHSVPGTGLKVQRSVSGGKPNLDITHIEALHAEGLIDRKTYLAITRKPDLPRVLDEEGLHKAIQKDPRLFFLLGTRAEPTLPTTTIKVAPDK